MKSTVAVIALLALSLLPACGPLLFTPPTIDTEDTGEPKVEVPLFFPLEDHLGEAPWGLKIEILDIQGGTGALGQFEIGDVPSVFFYVTDYAGVPYHPSQLTGLDIGVSGPSNHMAIVYWYDDLDDVLERSEAVEWVMEDPEGGPVDVIAWRYTFAEGVPANYAPAPNDTPDIGSDVGDWGGLPLVDGSYAFAVWGSVRHSLASGSETDGASDTVWELFGEAESIEIRERVLMSNCAKCHGEPIEAHGGTRTGGIDLCFMCHVQGAEDRYSVEDQLTTPGATIFMPVMIHKIHAGEYLTKGYELNGYPATPRLPGYPNYNTHSFGEVVMPLVPNGVSNCHACHEGAAQGDEIQSLVARNPCGACHDAVVWATGVGHDDGRPATDDSTCANTGCHPATQIKLDHLDIRLDPARNPGIHFEIIEVRGGSGSGGQFLPGDALDIEFSLLHDDGTEIDPTTLGRAKVKMTGPLDEPQRLFDETLDTTALVHNIVEQTWSYTTASLVPALYPAQSNDTSDIGVEDGDWVGLDLDSGTYRVSVQGYIDVVDQSAAAFHVPDSDVYDVLVGDATVLDEKEPVDEARCAACHQRIWGHGEQRGGVRLCPQCHTAGAEDRASATSPEVTPGYPIEFKQMIHQIHNSSNAPEPLVIAGYKPGPSTGYTLHEFDVTYPWFQGGTAHCESCHGEKYKEATGRVCLSCHEAASAFAHVSLNTDPVLGEACGVCHGQGRVASVEEVHHQHHAPE